MSSFLDYINSHLKFKIKGKLRIAFVGFSIIPILAVGSVAWMMNMNSLRQGALKNISHLSDLVIFRLNEFSKLVKSDLDFLQENLHNSYDFNKAKITEKVAADIFLYQVKNLLLNKTAYYRVTYLSAETQRSAFCFTRDLNNFEDIYAVESNQSWFYYNLLVNDLKQDQIRLTPVELVDYRYEQTMAIFSFVLPVFSQNGETEGILIADIFAEKLFTLIESSLAKENDYSAGVVDWHGHYLYHSQKKNDWNKLLAEVDVFTVEKEFSPEIAKKILSKSPGWVDTKKGDMIFHSPLVMGGMDLDQGYFFYIEEPARVIFADIYRIGIISILSILGFIIIAIFLSTKATMEFLVPIKKLQDGSDIIAKGKFSHRLNITSGDEIQELADTFNYMARSIQDRDKKLNDYNINLETEINKRTKELEDEKNKLRIVLDNVPSTLILVDNNQRILTASSALNDLMGIKSSAVIGKKCHEIFKPEIKCKDCWIKGNKQEAIIKKVQNTIINENGEKRTLEQISIPVKLTSGEQACLLIISDITMRVRLQNQLLQSEKLASIGEMAAVIAHEIRNSLTSVNMLLQLIQESDSIGLSEHESLDVILLSIKRINKVTQDLLNFARPGPLNIEIGNMKSVVDECIALYGPHLIKNHIKLKFESKKMIPSAKFDKYLIQDVINNILLNAIQAIGEKGEINVSLNSTKPSLADKERMIQLYEMKGAENGKILKNIKEIIELKIHDSGPGFKTDTLEKIFDPFFTTKINGTGLGLSMARRVIESHGGSIFADSGDDHGGTITLILPIN